MMLLMIRNRRLFELTRYHQRCHNSWSSKNVRSTFIDYFKGRGHTYVPSSSVIPKKNDGTYFVNAGMNQFKPIFLEELPQDHPFGSLKRAVNSQKCIRVGGKHNDLADVGLDSYHHTFFEMLGSWSFGDYFKEDACKMAWELLTDVYKLPRDRLYVTYFGGDLHMSLNADEETRDIWRSIGIAEDRILPFGTVDNFWSMGDTGPCGPCTEIHYDHLARPHAPELVNTGSPDLVELWNLVFMQYNRGSDGKLHSLKRNHVDTGMGLERLTAVLQSTTSNYETDLFLPMFDHIHQKCNVPAYNSPEASEELNIAYRTVADHTRMVIISMADGLYPAGQQERQKRLRQIMEKCFKLTKQHFTDAEFLSSLVPYVVESLGDTYPNLVENQERMCDLIKSAHQRYTDVANKHSEFFNKALQKFGVKPGDTLSGEQIYEICSGKGTQHFMRVEDVVDLAEAQGIRTDVNAYKEIMHQMNVNSKLGLNRPLVTLDPSEVRELEVMGVEVTDDSFKYQCKNGHHELNANIKAIKTDKSFVQSLAEREMGGVIVDQSNFYSEAGGQMGDHGIIRLQNGVEFIVTDTQKFGNYVLHIGQLETGSLNAEDTVTLIPDQISREKCALNHTCTHLLNHAITHVLGVHTQQGSRISHEKFTLDFRTEKVIDVDFIMCKITLDYLAEKLTSVNAEEMRAIESIVNKLIEDNRSIKTEELSLENAMQIPGLRTLKETIYPSTVRVVSVESRDHSMTSAELCGGTHAENTGDVGSFVITNFTTSGDIHSVTAVTGEQAKQAIGNANSVREEFDELLSCVENNTNKSQWPQMSTSISERLGSFKLISKIERDWMLRELLRIKHEHGTSRTMREGLAENIQNLIHQQIQEGRLKEPLIFPLKKKMKAKEMDKLVNASELQIPVLLIAQKKEPRYMIFCTTPHNCDVTAENFAASICDILPNSRHAPLVFDSENSQKRIINFKMIGNKNFSALNDEIIGKIKQSWLDLVDKKEWIES